MKTQTTEQKKLSAEEINEMIKRFHEQPWTIMNPYQNNISDLSLSDLISLHGWIDDEADLIEALGGDNTDKLEQAREQMVLVHQEIERIRSLIFGTESEF